MLVLTIPWILLLLLVITVVFLFKKKWKIALLLLLLTLAINWWSDCFCFGFKNTFSGDLKVLSFNVNGEGQFSEEKLCNVLSLVEKENPDILFLTENFNPLGDSLHARLHLIYPYDMLGMPHNIIYSRYVINEKSYKERLNGGTSFIVSSSISIKGNDIIVFGGHLSSNNYSSNMEYLTPSDVETFFDMKSYLSNIDKASHLRELEADTIVGAFFEKDNVIVMGDLNDVCGSPALKKFATAGLKDAWSEGGFGYGATIHTPIPYRIDHILHSEGLVLKGVKVIDTSDISDHNALVAVFDFCN